LNIDATVDCHGCVKLQAFQTYVVRCIKAAFRDTDTHILARKSRVSDVRM